MQHSDRTNSTVEFTIWNIDLPMLLVRARIAKTLNVPVLFLERFSIFHYETGQRFARHFDFLDPSNPSFLAEVSRHGQRAATFLVYLNDDFEGGETNFLAVRKALRGRSGDALFFYNLDDQGRPDALTLHEGKPPVRGEKWLLSQFVRDQAQVPG